MDSITALQRQRRQSRGMVANETISASETSSCGTVTVTADDGGDGGETDPGDGGGTDPGDGGSEEDMPLPGGVGTTSVAIAGGLGLLGVLLLLLN